MPLSSQTRLRSSNDIHSSDWLVAIPTEEITTLDDATFQCAVAKRLGFHILSTEVYCEGCGHRMHASGYHRMNCMRTGRVQYRHKPLVNLWVRILSEAGVAVPKRSVERFLRTTHIRRGPQDARRMDIVTSGIAGVFRGKPLFIDATCLVFILLLIVNYIFWNQLQGSGEKAGCICLQSDGNPLAAP